MGRRLTREEISSIGIYGFLGYIGAFNSPYIGGIQGTKKLQEKLNIKNSTDFHVLEIGCATGYAACMLGEEYGCKVTGIDISDVLIEKAKERADKRGLENVNFQTADAINLPFEDDTFDAVYGVAVTALVPDSLKALSEYYRVVRPGGIVGTLDLFLSKTAPIELAEKINEVMSGVLGGDVAIRSIDEWRTLFDHTPLVETELTETFGEVFENPKDRLSSISATFRLFYHMLVNKTVRSKMSEALRLRKVANLKEGADQKHVGYLTFTGMK
ncbi:MAG: class I SAM-dependent methyltransferase [Candidatus Thorarchaeota archaeon]|nr:class I SAM-dependent methyltransferase [Candidatus Thorarchaeota archaeon]